MNLDIRKNVYENIESDSPKDIINMINESVSNEDELTLPGLGVLLELFWNNISYEEKNNLANIIKKELQNRI